LRRADREGCPQFFAEHNGNTRDRRFQLPSRHAIIDCKLFQEPAPPLILVSMISTCLPSRDHRERRKLSHRYLTVILTVDLEKWAKIARFFRYAAVNQPRRRNLNASPNHSRNSSPVEPWSRSGSGRQPRRGSGAYRDQPPGQRSNRERGADTGSHSAPVPFAQVANHSQLQAMNGQHVRSEPRWGSKSRRSPVGEQIVR
jgi:hypothetical protein